MPALDDGPDEEELVIRASQFKSVLEKFAIKEEDYCKTIETLEKDNCHLRQQLENMTTALEKMQTCQQELVEEKLRSKKLSKENKKVRG